jgi:RNA polymerase sigma factor (sigma-70 family)
MARADDAETSGHSAAAVDAGSRGNALPGRAQWIPLQAPAVYARGRTGGHLGALASRRAGSSPPSPRAANDLAKVAAEGDVLAIRRLLEIVAPHVAQVVRIVVGAGHPDLDDAAQLSLMAFIQALPTFRGECSPEQFAAHIAGRKAVAMRCRSRAREDSEDRAVDVEAIAGQCGEVEANRRRDSVRSLLDGLPEEQAEVLVLRVMLGWALREIAETTGTPLNTVRSRIRLAKEAVRRRLADDPALADALDLRAGDL